MSDLITINTNCLEEAIRCAICKNPIKSDRGCDGSCQYDKELHAKIVEAVEGIAEQRPHGEWKYESYGQYLSTYKCSNCGFHGDKQWICCPYCGADMRKEGEAE